MADFSAFILEKNLIGGKWESADNGQSIPVTNPATGDTIGTVPNCGAAETERAIAEAALAFNTSRRVQVLKGVFLLLIQKIPPGIEPCVTYLIAMTGPSSHARDSDRLEPFLGRATGFRPVRRSDMWSD